MIYNESDNSLYPQLEIGTNPFYHKMIFFYVESEVIWKFIF